RVLRRVAIWDADSAESQPAKPVNDSAASGLCEAETRPDDGASSDDVGGVSEPVLKANDSGGVAHKCFGFPILLRSEALGILRLSTRNNREPDAEVQEMMSTIGSHLGQLIDRARTEGARKEAEAIRAWNARSSLLRAEVGIAMAQHAQLRLILQQCS